MFDKKYRAPVISYVSRGGLAAHAEDLAQEVFVRLFHGGVLQRAKPGSGRFRTLLMTVTRNVMTDHRRKEGALKRGGGAILNLGDTDVPAEEVEAFDREWLLNLLDLAMARLGREHPVYHEVLERTLLLDGRQADVAREMGKTVGGVRNNVLRAKRKLIGYLREEAWSYSDTREQYAEELQELAGLLGKRPQTP